VTASREAASRSTLCDGALAVVFARWRAAAVAVRAATDATTSSMRVR